MFPSTITITTASGVDKILNRVNQDSYGSEYLLIDATTRNTLKIRHNIEGSKDSSSGVMARHNVFFEQVEFPTLTTAQVLRSYTMTIRAPELSDPAVLAAIAAGVQGWIATSTNLSQIASGVN